MSVKLKKEGKETKIVYVHYSPAIGFASVGIIIFGIGIASVVKAGFFGIANLLFGLMVTGIGVFAILKKQEIVVDTENQEVRWQTIKIKLNDIEEFYIRSYYDNPGTVTIPGGKKGRHRILCTKKDGTSVELLPEDSNIKDKQKILSELRRLGFKTVEK